jgi:hypothetical protein
MSIEVYLIQALECFGPEEQIDALDNRGVLSHREISAMEASQAGVRRGGQQGSYKILITSRPNSGCLTPPILSDFVTPFRS